MSNPEILRLNIPYDRDRENIITALANSGYKVWVEEVKEQFEMLHIVCYEYTTLRGEK